jgi:diguanylate cyclase (GGDEF)-like protein
MESPQQNSMNSPPEPSSPENIGNIRADHVRREMRNQLAELTSYGQWLLFPLLAVLALAFWNHIPPIPLLSWAGCACLLLLLFKTNFKPDQPTKLSKPNQLTGIINLTLAFGFGCSWGCLPLVAATWGDRDAVWLSVMVVVAVTSGLVIMQATSRRVFLTALLPMMSLSLLGLWYGQLPWLTLIPLTVLFLAYLILIHNLLLKQQLQRVRAILHSREQAAELSFTIQHHDPLTGLFNRAGLGHWLNLQLNQPRPASRMVLLIGVVKGFGDINTLYGTDVGDKLLREIAYRLIDLGKGRFAIARLSGAEFALIDARAVTELESLRKVFALIEAEGFKIGDHMINVVLQQAWVEGHLHEIDVMLEGVRTKIGEHAANSDDPVSLTVTGQRRELVQSFHQGLLNNEITPWFQPVVDCQTQLITGWEALARWSHPRLGVIGPDQFVDIARISNQSNLLTKLIFKGAIKFIHELQNLGQHDCAVVNINFTASMLAEKDTLAWIVAILNDGGIHPSQIVLEISEQEALGLDEQFRLNIIRLQDLGIQLAIDDFGTGYANLGHLLDLPASSVKLDKRFIDKLPHDKDSAALVRAVLTLASGLNMKTVAEGVERSEQLEFLRLQGCDCYQGFYASLALPMIAALDFTQRWRGKPVALANSDH